MKFKVVVCSSKEEQILEIEAKSEKLAIIKALDEVDDTPLFLRMGSGRWVNYGDSMYQFCTADYDFKYPRLTPNSLLYRAQVCARV